MSNFWEEYYTLEEAKKYLHNVVLEEAERMEKSLKEKKEVNSSLISA